MSQGVINIENSMVETQELDTPPLEEIATVLRESLKSDFQKIEIKVKKCPDLTQPPFTLVCKGLSGKAAIVEVGGVPYLLPRANREKLYDLKDVKNILGLNSCCVIGAGAGPWPFAGTNCELIVNMKLEEDRIDNKNRIVKVDKNTGESMQEALPNEESRNAMLSNLYCSLGEEGEVLEVSCSNRIGNNDFVTSIRKALAEHYKDKCIGLGGVFLIKKGKVKQHVMPEFLNEDINSDDDLNKWLKFYEMNSPLIALGTLVTQDPGLDLRLQHFHSFSHHGEGGHYHIDTTPKDVEYLAYFGLGEKIYRIDRPKKSHNYGRD